MYRNCFTLRGKTPQRQFHDHFYVWNFCKNPKVTLEKVDNQYFNYRSIDFFFRSSKDGAICDPRIFNEFCKDNTMNGTAICKTAACNFKEVLEPPEVTYYEVLVDSILNTTEYR